MLTAVIFVDSYDMCVLTAVLHVLTAVIFVDGCTMCLLTAVMCVC